MTLLRKLLFLLVISLTNLFGPIAKAQYNSKHPTKPGPAPMPTQVKPADENSTEDKKIVLMGIDAANNGIEQAIPLVHFRSALQNSLSAVHDSVLSSLKNKTTAPPMALRKTLELRTVGVGVGLAGQIGLSVFLNVTVRPRIRLVFSNSKTPIYPN